MNSRLFYLLITVVAFSSCRSMAYFDTPNNLKNMPATLYLADGKSYKGKLVVHTNKYSSTAVKMYLEGDKKPMNFSIADVKGYQFRNDYYELKEVRGGIRLGKEYSFMKRRTKNDSRIYLYENTRKVTTSSGPNMGSYTYYETEYFLKMPNEEGDAVWPLSSSKFVPNFDEKMSKLVADCPTLAAKISSKEDGYFYAQVSLSKEKRANVLMNIIDEYNECKR
jgi:hypothetical protein